MALLIDSDTPVGTDSPNTIDDQIRAFKLAIEGIFGITKNSTITVSPMTIASSGGLVTVNTDWTWIDNAKVTLGTGGDADLSYDGTDVILDVAVVGSGDFYVKGGRDDDRGAH